MGWMTTVGNDNGAIGGWLEEHRGILGKIARSFAGGAAEIAELEQEMAYQLWQSLPRFAGQAKRSTWVYRVCLNTALTWKRGVVRRRKRFDGEVEVSNFSAVEASPAESAEQRDWLERLYEALHALAGPERALVVLSLDGLSYRELAEVTGMTESHVGVALLRARRRLAEAMKGVIDELE